MCGALPTHISPNPWTRSFWLLALSLVAGCGSSAAPIGGTPEDADVSDDGAPDGAVPADATPDDGPEIGPPRRLACVPTSGLAKDLPPLLYGAVEGELVTITPPNAPGNTCPEDSGHVHLQLDIGGKRYDVAVNVESTSGAQMAIFTKDLPASLNPPGYTNSGFDFPISLGAHSGDFTSLSKAALVTRLQTELKGASRVSIHGLTYDDGSGIHNVHKNAPGRDGAIVVRGGGAGGTDHVIALRFSDDVF